jgi:hypothetical protein
MPNRLRTLLTKAAATAVALRFTIRDLLWLTVLAALAVSWWIDNKRIEKALVNIRSKEAELDEFAHAYDDALVIIDNWNKKHGIPSGHLSALEKRAAALRNGPAAPP